MAKRGSVLAKMGSHDPPAVTRSAPSAASKDAARTRRTSRKGAGAPCASPVGKTEVEIAEPAPDGDLADIDIGRPGVAHPRDIGLEPVEAAVDLAHLAGEPFGPATLLGTKHAFVPAEHARFANAVPTVCTVSTSQRRAPDAGITRAPPWRESR